MDLNLEDKTVDSFKQLFAIIYKGDKHAEWLSLAILHVLHTWDDLVDKDKPVASSSINSSFVLALADISTSPLWDASMAITLKSVYFRWQTANTIERTKESTDNDLAKAWMLRAGCYDFFVLIARKLHGDAWAEQISPTVYNFYGEPLTDFIQEIRNA